MQTFDIHADINEFRSLCEQSTSTASYPLAQDIEKNIPVYEGDFCRRSLESPIDKVRLQSEFIDSLSKGPGIVFIKNFYTDPNLDEINSVFESILATEARNQAADHFAKAGSNGRIWNALQKHAEANPESFIDYYSNPLLSLISSAWLGPWFQVTAQVNIVRPGSPAQAPHRDYHLGFQDIESVKAFPLHVQKMSAHLTLQGAIAHSDMPVKSGPTLLLPFSQQFDQGYMAWRQQDFQDYFSAHKVQLPLEKGDGLFFNPALFHAAGNNTTQSLHRKANLLQISSAFARPMESVDRYLIANTIYPDLLERQESLSDIEINTLLDCVAESYPFPTNLDKDPPVNGLAPCSHRQLLESALREKLSPEELQLAQQRLRERQRA